MSTKLSHSQISKYMQCGHSYKLHYIDKIRPKVTHAALIFGSAIDAALGALLTEKGNPEHVFETAFTNNKVNDEAVYIPTHPELVYANSDFDSDLLIEEDYKFLKTLSEESTIPRYNNYLDVYKIVAGKKQQDGLDSLDTKERVFLNVMNWLSLRRKGLLMLVAYRKKVMPKINKVIAIQEYISLSNADGDSVIGYVDLIADIKDVGVVILDNKTSAMEYEKDSVISSPQLSLYLHMLEEKYSTRKAGYIVLRKQVIKNRKKVCKTCGHDGSGGRHKTCDAIVDGSRCNGEWTETIDPDIAVQFIIDEIPEQTEMLVMENIDGINHAIKQKHFTRNLNSCHNHFGGKCPYFNLCYKNDMTNLKEIK